MNQKEFAKEFESQINDFCQMIYNNKPNQLGNLKRSFSFDYQNDVIISSMEQLDKFNHIINDITYYVDFKGRFSSEYIEEEVIRLLHKLLDDSTRASVYLQELYTNLYDKSDHEWFIITQLNNIELKKTTPFKLIDSTMKIMFQEDFLEESTAIKHKRQDQSVTNLLNMFLLPDSLDNWILKPCIYTNVKAGDKFKARDFAIDNFNTSINLLRLYFPNYKITIEGYISLSDNPINNSQNIISYDKTEGFRNLSPLKILPRFLKLDIELYKELEKLGIHNLSDNSEISKRIKECLYWYGLALDTSFLSAKLLNYVTILEHILKIKDEKTELSQRIADRCALFLETDFKKRKDICEKIKDIYDLRSNIVHSGDIFDKNPMDKKPKKKIEDLRSNLELVNRAAEYARSVLLKLIKENNRFNGDFNAFIYELDDMKYKYTDPKV